MATLHNKNHDLSISIYFFHNDDPRDREWIKYQIVVESVRDPGHPVVFDDDTANTYLYLENCIEPEVPDLVEKIRELCDRGLDDVTFRPIDDRDFTLIIQPAAKAFEVSLELEFAKKAQTFTMQTNREHLLDFAKEMEKEYEDLIHKKHGLVPHKETNQ